MTLYLKHQKCFGLLRSTACCCSRSNRSGSMTLGRRTPQNTSLNVSGFEPMLFCMMFIRANHYTTAALKCPPYLIRMSTLIVIHWHLKRWVLYYVCSMAIIGHFRVTKMFINSDEMSLFLPKMPFFILTQIDKKFQINFFFVN